jgi:glycosyltransferase involved in cell wall biosynthesis
MQQQSNVDLQSATTQPNLDIVVPVYNEEEAIEKFHQQLWQMVAELPYKVTTYYVNDGSANNTGSILRQLAASNPHLFVAELSRNFGHQAALSAGLDLSNADVVIMMDGDGQHPPELIPQMLELYQIGYDVVLTQRSNDRDLAFFKRTTSSAFYGLLNRIGETKIVPGVADYRLMSRQAVDALKQMPEYHRFLRGMISWMGYRSVILPYAARERLGGKPKYSLSKMAGLAFDAIFSFSLIPLRIGIALGIFFLILASAEILYVLSFWVRGREELLVPGWSSLMFMLLIVRGILLITIGTIAIYVGYIFQEVKRRPQYLIRTVFTGHPETTKRKE